MDIESMNEFSAREEFTEEDTTLSLINIETLHETPAGGSPWDSPSNVPSPISNLPSPTNSTQQIDNELARRLQNEWERLQETPAGSPLNSPIIEHSENHSIQQIDNEFVRLHIELEIDNELASVENQIITKCIAEVLELSSSDVQFAGVEETFQNEQYIALFHCSIPTTKNQIEDLVTLTYNAILTQQLHAKILQYWQEIGHIVNTLTIEIRELYETDHPEAVELHFELEIDESHAFQKNQIIKKCLAGVLQLPYSRVYIDKITPVKQHKLPYLCPLSVGLYCGHIPTTKNEIEQLVEKLFMAIENKDLQTKIETFSCINNQKAIVEVRELYETDQDVEDYNMNKYNINEVNNRLKLNQKCGYDRIKTFSRQIYDAMKVLINESEFTVDIIKEILLYSNHEQIIGNWYSICNKLGPFAYLISDKNICTIDLIEQFEEKVNYNLPLNVRLSLLICDSIQCPLIDIKYSNFQECVILPIKDWIWFSDENNSLKDKLDDMWFEYISKDLVLIGYCCNDCVNGSIEATAVLNILNNKVLIEIKVLKENNVLTGVESVETEIRKIFDFDDWFMNPYYMLDYRLMCLLSANDCLGDRDDYDNTLFCTGDEIRYLMFKWTDWHIENRNNDIIYNNNCMEVYYDLYISKMYEIKYNPLIYGYTRNMEKMLSMKSVPVCVIDMIWRFFPFFVENEQCTIMDCNE